MIDLSLLKHIPFFKLRRYQHLNTIRVRRSALEYNYQQLSQTHPEARIAAVLKSNAYGHGLKLVAPIFDRLKAPFLVVDSLYEAYELYKIGTKTPILIIGYTNSINFSVKKLPFEYAVSDIATARSLDRDQPGCNIHLFIDTGLCREGIVLDDLEVFISQLKQCRKLNVTGVCSHFSDTTNSKSMALQINRFKEAVKVLKNNGIDPRWRHISASGGTFKVFDPMFNLIRPGLALYGINSTRSLRPALSFTTTIVQIKKLHKGDRIGYGATFAVEKPMTVALLPAGYYEGVDRRLSNCGFVSVANIDCPIVGVVSMNLTVIDISAVPTVKVGDRCVIYSDDPKNKNSIESAAQITKTIPSEILVHLAESVRRIVME